MKHLVLIVETRTNQLGITQTAACIKKIKRGTSLETFITSYLDNELIPIDLRLQVSREINEIAVFFKQPSFVRTWTFIKYQGNEVMQAVRELSKEEQLRDIAVLREFLVPGDK